MKNVKKGIVTFIVIILVLAGFYFGKNNERDGEYETTKYSYFQYFDTFIDVTIYEEVTDDELEEKIENKISDVHMMVDNFNQHEVDGLYELNVNGAVSNEELAKLIEYGVSYYNDYSIQFNPALGPVIDIWKKALVDCNENSNCYVPMYEELESSGNINSNDIVINNDSISIKSDMKVDLGAISKGYLTDELNTLLIEEGYNNFLINAGGNIYATKKPGEEAFRISVVDPINNQESFTTLEIKDKSIVTSGDYERYFEVDGVRYNHLINGETLFPSNFFHSVTIISDKSIDGDILATMLFGLEYEEGLDIVESLEGVEAIWYTHDKEILRSSGVSEYEKE